MVGVGVRRMGVGRIVLAFEEKKNKKQTISSYEKQVRVQLKAHSLEFKSCKL